MTTRTTGGGLIGPHSHLRLGARINAAACGQLRIAAVVIENQCWEPGRINQHLSILLAGVSQLF
jgi:hypothetical protein